MSVFLRGNIWWMEVTEDGKPVQKSTKVRVIPGDEGNAISRAMAKNVEKAARGVMAPEPVDTTPKVFTLKDAFERWFEETEGELRSIEDNRSRGQLWIDQLGHLPLNMVTRDQIMQVIADKVAGKFAPTSKFASKTPKKISGSTVNRYLSAITTVLKKCADEWRLIDEVPRIQRRAETGTSRAGRGVDYEALVILYNELPDHLRPIFNFSVLNGLRQANVCKMEWAWIDMKNSILRIPAGKFKNKDDHIIPLDAPSMQIVRDQVGKHPYRVFTYEGKPLESPTGGAWDRALARAKPIALAAGYSLEGFRWHDIRHSWASLALRRGVPATAIKALGGWKNMAMVDRYAKYDVDSLRQYQNTTQR